MTVATCGVSELCKTGDAGVVGPEGEAGGAVWLTGPAAATGCLGAVARADGRAVFCPAAASGEFAGAACLAAGVRLAAATALLGGEPVAGVADAPDSGVTGAGLAVARGVRGGPGSIDSAGDDDPAAGPLTLNASALNGCAGIAVLADVAASIASGGAIGVGAVSPSGRLPASELATGIDKLPDGGVSIESTEFKTVAGTCETEEPSSAAAVLRARGEALAVRGCRVTASSPPGTIRAGVETGAMAASGTGNAASPGNESEARAVAGVAPTGAGSADEPKAGTAGGLALPASALLAISGLAADFAADTGEILVSSAAACADRGSGTRCSFAPAWSTRAPKPPV